MTIEKFVEENIFKPANRNQAATVSVDFLITLYAERVDWKSIDYWKNRHELEREMKKKRIRRCGKYKYKVDECGLTELISEICYIYRVKGGDFDEKS